MSEVPHGLKPHEVERRMEVTQKRILAFCEAILAHDRKTRPADIDPILWQACRDGYQSQLDDLVSELNTLRKLR